MLEGNGGNSYLGLALANNRAAASAQRNAEVARNGASDIATSALSIAVALQQARNEIAQLETNLMTAEAHISGLKAIVASVKNFHPNGPLSASTGLFYKSGRIKTRASIIWATAHDEYLTKKGIKNPSSYRED